MNIEELREFCLTLPGTTEDIKWESNLTFCIIDKIYLLVSLEDSPTRATFKVANEEFEEWASKDGFRPAPYLARAKWVTLDDTSSLDTSIFKERIENSYQIISKKLTKKQKTELGLI